MSMSFFCLLLLTEHIIVIVCHAYVGISSKENDIVVH